MKLAQREFSLSDQTRFASVSGDHNPIHLDSLHARRTQAGAPVVHGIHLLLWALDSLAEAQADLPSLSNIHAVFNKYTYLQECAELVLTQQRPSGARLSISAEGVLRSKINLGFGDTAQDFPGWPAASLERISFSPAPRNLSIEQMASRSGRLPFQMTQEDAETLFPGASRWLGARRIVALAASTHLVGMVCPGLRSIYSELTVSTCTEPFPENSLAFRVTETDARFGLVEQEIAGGGLTGTAISHVRTSPVEQATMESIAGLVAPAEFAGSLALIVGGSRGLGELTAKLIAAGGGRVIITWQTGREDAEKVAREIRSAGGACETLCYDARKPAAEQLAMLADAPTHAYYFATPTIYRPQADIFVAERLKEFLTFYVDGFWQLSQALRARQPSLSFFYPSTVFVTERPREMKEYAMAKAVGEMLCADINASLAPTHVTLSRLPRLATDQTASVAGPETTPALETMLPIVREVQTWPR
jgi:hypothetical protein